MRKNKLQPLCDSLESRELLAVLDMSTYFQPYIQKSGPKNVYVLPGMEISTKVNTSVAGSNYIGLKKVTYNFSGYDINSPYSFTFGDYIAQSTIVDQRLNSQGQPWADPNMTSYAKFFAPKEEGNYTISITAIVTRMQYFPSLRTIDDTFTDTLSFTVESPNINSHSVEIKHGIDFGVTTQGVGFVGNAGNGQLAEFRGSVTNDTHYIVMVGFIQVVEASMLIGMPSSSIEYNSEGKQLDYISYSSSKPSWYHYMENYGVWFVLPNTTRILWDNDQNYLVDTPHALFDEFHEPSQEYLDEITVDWDFETHLAIQAGALAQTSNWLYNNIPISLSTASWSFGGSATKDNFGEWNVESIYPEIPETHNGDSTIKNIEWVDNVYSMYFWWDEFQLANIGATPRKILADRVVIPHNIILDVIDLDLNKTNKKKTYTKKVA